MTRPRGFAQWRPHRQTLALLDDVNAVLAEYSDYLPLTLRQLFYRLVAAHEYPKLETAYERLCNVMNRARRARLVAFDAIRDDGLTVLQPNAFDGKPQFWDAVQRTARDYRRDRLEGQRSVVEVWVEATGMAPTVANAVDEYGVAVYSSGGFDCLTAKYEAAMRIARRERPTMVLHIGDHDPSGITIFESAAEDVAALTLAVDEPEFRRVAVTPEQIERYSLPTAPPKARDRRSAWRGGGTVQAEALPPDVLVAEVRQAVETCLDLRALAETLADETRERTELLEELDAMEAA